MGSGVGGGGQMPMEIASLQPSDLYHMYTEHAEGRECEIHCKNQRFLLKPNLTDMDMLLLSY